MAEFYKLKIARWNNGTASLNLEQEAAYLRIVNAINLGDEPCPANPFVLAGMFRTNTQKAARLLRDLVNAGKVWVEDGRIHNRHAAEDIEDRQQLREKRVSAGSEGGKAKAKNAAQLPLGSPPVGHGLATSRPTHEQPRANPEQTEDCKPLENKETGLANATPREEKRREEVEEKEEPKGSSKKKDAAKKSPASVLAPLLGDQAAAEVVEHRQRIRKPMTQRAAELMLLEFEKCPDPVAGAEMMISRGWLGFRADWYANETSKTNGRTNPHDKHREEKLDNTLAFARSLDEASRRSG